MNSICVHDVLSIYHGRTFICVKTVKPRGLGKPIYENIYLLTPQEAEKLFISEENSQCSFFSDIDYIIPLPLNSKKLKLRGYNQCDAICRGLTKVTKIPVLYDVVERVIANSTQTKKSRVERELNVEQIFRLTGMEEKRALLIGKHVLLVDDVCTTGSTLKSFASVFNEIPDIRISILTLGLASPVF